MPNLNPVTLRTGRLTLRWLDERDAADLFALYSDPNVVRYWSSPAWTDMAQAHAMLAETLDGYRSGTALRLAIVCNASGSLIGNIGLHHFFEMNRRCELGYALGSAQWGQGYATEALRAALGYGFDALDLNRVEADIDPRNGASGKVLERLGFQKEGYMRERWIVNGETCDTVYYGLLQREWKSM